MKSRRGLTLVELMLLISVLGIVAAMSLPKVNQLLRQNRAISASVAVASDVEGAFSLAARERKPVRLTYDAPSEELRLADRAAGTIYRHRPLGATSEFKLDAVDLSPPTVDFFPNGLASSAFTITLTDGKFARQVVVTRTGLTRTVVP